MVECYFQSSYRLPPTTLLKVTLLHEGFSRILNCANGTKSPKASYFKLFLDNFECGKCQRVFTSIMYLLRHIKRVCPDMSQRKWKCEKCSKAFRHPFGLQQHLLTHTGKRPHHCPECPKSFYSANDLRRHSRTHSG